MSQITLVPGFARAGHKYCVETAHGWMITNIFNV